MGFFVPFSSSAVVYTCQKTAVIAFVLKQPRALHEWVSTGRFMGALENIMSELKHLVNGVDQWAT